MKIKFEDLIIWQKAMDLGENIDKLADTFPKKEFNQYYDDSFNLMNMMIAFKNKIK